MASHRANVGSSTVRVVAANGSRYLCDNLRWSQVTQKVVANALLHIDAITQSTGRVSLVREYQQIIIFATGNEAID